MHDFNHIYEVLATSILETISPTLCVGCDLPGMVLCPECASDLPFIDFSTACPRCGAPFGKLQCTECVARDDASWGSDVLGNELATGGGLAAGGLAGGGLAGGGLAGGGLAGGLAGGGPAGGGLAAGNGIAASGGLAGGNEGAGQPAGAFPFTRARSALSFEGAARDIIRTYKDHDELQLDVVIASLLCATIRAREARQIGRGHLSRFEAPQRADYSNVEDWTSWADALVCVPASPEALLRRGFDHMLRIGKLCSKWTGIPLVELLNSREGAKDQRDLNREERIANRSESFEWIGDASPPQHVILLDDVFTTGATLSATTNTLLEGGVAEVRTVTLARVW